MSKNTNTRLPIHTDTQQEIDQAQDRKRVRPRNEETGEIIPVAIAALDGGDGEGIYVMPKQHVRIEVGGGVVKLTPKNARLMAAELVAGADALAPRKRGKGKKRRGKTSMGHRPTQLVVDGHVGPAWAVRSSDDRWPDGRLEGLTWWSRDNEVVTQERQSLTVIASRAEGITDGRWQVGELRLWIDCVQFSTEQAAALVDALTALQSNLALTPEPSQPVEFLTENAPGGKVAMPPWAREIDQEGGMLVWTTDATVGATDYDGHTFKPMLSQSDTEGSKSCGVPFIFPTHTDDSFTIPQARILAAGIVELCDKADGVKA